MPPITLQDVTDRQEIADLISRLGLWLDDKRFDDARSVFTEDAVVETPGGSTRGTDGVADQARRNHAVDGTQHVITNVLIELDGDRATARANLIATFVQSADDRAAHVTQGERYRFEAARASDGWRLSRVDVTPVWSSDSSG